jgi:hypothetical protein
MSKKDFLDPITPGEILREDFMEPMGIGMNKILKSHPVLCQLGHKIYPAAGYSKNYTGLEPTP